jgi:hypothetical protein
MPQRHQPFAGAAFVVPAGELAGEIGARLGLRALIGCGEDCYREIYHSFTDGDQDRPRCRGTDPHTRKRRLSALETICGGSARRQREDRARLAISKIAPFTWPTIKRGMWITDSLRSRVDRAPRSCRRDVLRIIGNATSSHHCQASRERPGRIGITDVVNAA